MNSVQKGLLYTALVLAAVYVVSLMFPPYPGHFAIKAIPAIALSILTLTAVKGLPGMLLFVSLLFCAAGDVALGLEGERFFIIGLVFFLVAQVFLIVTFSRDLKKRRSRLPIIAALIAYGTVMAFVLKPWLGELMIPVLFYIAVITTMGVFAALRASESRLVLYGALSFIVSDSLIAINVFTTWIPASGYLVMTTYYLALFLIAYGHVREARI